MFSILGLVLNITLLIAEYKQRAIAQSISLGYKPVRPSYFVPNQAHHPGYYPPSGYFWPTAETPSTTTPTTTTEEVVINRNPDFTRPEQVDGKDPLYNPFWSRPTIVLSNHEHHGGEDCDHNFEDTTTKKNIITTRGTSTTERTTRFSSSIRTTVTPQTSTTTATTTTTTHRVPTSTTQSATSTSSTSTSTIARSSIVPFLPDIELFTSAPSRFGEAVSQAGAGAVPPPATNPHRYRPALSVTQTATSMSSSIALDEPTQPNAVVADLLPIGGLFRESKATNVPPVPQVSNLLLPASSLSKRRFPVRRQLYPVDADSLIQQQIRCTWFKLDNCVIVS